LAGKRFPIEIATRYLDQRRLNGVAKRVVELLAVCRVEVPQAGRRMMMRRQDDAAATSREALFRLLASFTEPLSPYQRSRADPAPEVDSARDRLVSELLAVVADRPSEKERDDRATCAEEVTTAFLAVARCYRSGAASSEAVVTLLHHLEKELCELLQHSSARREQAVKDTFLREESRASALKDTADEAVGRFANGMLAARIYGTTALTGEQLARVCSAVCLLESAGSGAKGLGMAPGGPSLTQWLPELSLRVLDENVRLSAENIATIVRGNSVVAGWSGEEVSGRSEEAALTAVFATGSVLSQRKMAEFSMSTLCWTICFGELFAVLSSGDVFVRRKRIGGSFSLVFRKFATGSLVELLQGFARVQLRDPFLVTRAVAQLPRLVESPNCHVLLVGRLLGGCRAVSWDLVDAWRSVVVARASISTEIILIPSTSDRGRSDSEYTFVSQVSQLYDLRVSFRALGVDSPLAEDLLERLILERAWQLST